MGLKGSINRPLTEKKLLKINAIAVTFFMFLEIIVALIFYRPRLADLKAKNIHGPEKDSGHVRSNI